jgi:hypothetical protein
MNNKVSDERLKELLKLYKSQADENRALPWTFDLASLIQELINYRNGKIWTVR